MTARSEPARQRNSVSARSVTGARRRLGALTLAAMSCGLAPSPARAALDPATAEEWTFRALLDGRPIGTHRFSLSGARGDERTLVSEADFAVKVLGWTAYRYHHHAVEQWRGDCLVGIDATTDDDGKTERVRLGPEGLAPCAMSFAYWNPALRKQTRLLNAQTGQFDPVQVARVGGGTLDVRGVPTAATRWRISGPAQPIDVWYGHDGRWLGLDSTVAGGRRLTYRLE